jgi:alpha/beta superfamily hydrolase
VARGEEKSIAIAGPAGLALEGVFVAGEDDAAPGAVIAPPHPLYGGSMDSPVLEEVAWALRRAGCASLRFNWRGVGASGGSTSGEARDADADYAAALEHLEETVPGPLIGAGYSFGAATAVRVAAPHTRVRRLLLVAPPPALLDAAALGDFAGSVLILTGARDEFAPPTELDAIVSGRPRHELHVIADADHFFGVGLAEIGRRVAAWLGA